MTFNRSLPRLVRKLDDAFGSAIRAALNDENVVEIMLNSDGGLYVDRSLSHVDDPRTPLFSWQSVATRPINRNWLAMAR